MLNSFRSFPQITTRQYRWEYKFFISTSHFQAFIQILQTSLRQIFQKDKLYHSNNFESFIVFFHMKSFLHSWFKLTTSKNQEPLAGEACTTQLCLPQLFTRNSASTYASIKSYLFPLFRFQEILIRRSHSWIKYPSALTRHSFLLLPPRIFLPVYSNFVTVNRNDLPFLF